MDAPRPENYLRNLNQGGLIERNLFASGSNKCEIEPKANDARHSSTHAFSAAAIDIF